MVDMNSVAQGLGRDESFCADFQTSRLKRLLRLGVGTLALLTAAPAIAGSLTNNGVSGTFDDPSLWSGTPTAQDSVSITGGTVSINGGDAQAGMLSISGGGLTAGTGDAAITLTDGLDLSGSGVVGKGVSLQSTADVPPTIVQSGDDSVFDGAVLGLDPDGYPLDGYTLFTSYTLNGGLVDVDANIGTGDLFIQNGGAMNGVASTWVYNLTGGSVGGTAGVWEFNVSDGRIEAGATVEYLYDLNINGGTFDDGSNIVMFPWGPGNGYVVQTAGAMNGQAQAVTYDMSGGDMGSTAVVDISDRFTLSGDATIESGATIRKGDPRFNIDMDNGEPEDNSDVPSPINTFAQSGGTMNGDVTTDVYEQSGGALGGTVTTSTYDLTSATATSSSNATINASTAFTLQPDSGVATVNAKLTGTGKLTKSGAGTAALTNGSNDFSGGIAVVEGTLQAMDDALPDNAAVNIAQNATLQMTISKDVATSFNGAITGGSGILVKDGDGTLALGKPLLVGDIDVDAGTLHLLSGVLPGDAAVSVAKDATLQVTVDSGKSTIFNGSMTGDEGKLVKDGAGALTLSHSVELGALDVNAGTLNIGTGVDANSTDVASFASAVIENGATVYVAKYATLTIRIPNNIINNGYLINDGTVNDDLANASLFDNNNTYNANVASNTGTINNNTPGLWTGDILTNSGRISNNVGATWNGSVVANIGTVNNAGTWVGDVRGTGTSGYWPDWTYGLVNNAKDAEWTGKVYDNYGSVRNVAATWHGDVVDNHSDLINDNSTGEADSSYWYGDVVGNHGTVFNAGGGIWHGDVLGNNGYIKSDRTSGYAFANGTGLGVAQWYGSVYGNASMIENRGLWTGDVVGNASSIANTGRWVGAVYSGNTGRIVNAEDDYNVAPSDMVRAAWIGDVQGNGGTIINLGADWTGAVQANTGTITNTGGRYNGILLGGATWSGNVVTNAGTITNASGSTWTGDVLANSGTIVNAGTWTGNFTNGAGGTVKAQSQIVGTFANAGTLKLTGALSGITTLTNTGLLDLHNGTTAGQTLTATTANLQSGSSMAVSVDTAGNTDKLIATTANLGGTVKVTLNPIAGNYDYSKTYTILTATTRNGSFGGVNTDLAFLTPQLSYGTPGAVTMTLVRNGQTFEQVATTPNQQSTGAAVESLGATNPLYAAILGLTTDEATDALDQVSGAAQGSTQTADIQAANLVSHILAGRINQAFDAIGGGDADVSNYAPEPEMVENPTPTSGIWGQMYGALGSVKGTLTMAGMNSSSGGFAGGIDGELGNWRIGVVVQAGTTGTNVPDLNSSSTSIDYGAGLYAGGEFGDTRLSLGAAYTRHSVGSTRHVAFPGFDETLTASYGAGTAQAFAQLSQDFDFGATSLTPYASVSAVANTTDAYTETGGTAALTSARSVIDATFTALGFDVSHQSVMGDDMLLTVDAGLGWRHAFAATPSASHAFAGGTSFTVLGAPLPADVALVSAGVNLDVSATTTVNVTYDGQFSTGTQTHGVKATWNGKF